MDNESIVSETAKEQMVTDASESDGQGFEYENFMRVCPVYHEVNADLLEMAIKPSYKRIIDLGCGTGNITQAIIERLSSFKDVVVYSIDTSQSMLREASRRLKKFGDKVDIRFIHGDVVDAVQRIDSAVDAIVYCNSIHYVKEKSILIKNIGDLLRPGGVFAANSSFITESHSSEYVGAKSNRFYVHLMLRAVKALKARYNLSPAKQVVESRNRLGVKQYCDLVEDAGMRVLHKRLDIKTSDFNCWYNFLNFKDFIEGALPGVPISIGREVLQRAVKILMFDSPQRFATVQRAWMQLVAQRV